MTRILRFEQLAKLAIWNNSQNAINKARAAKTIKARAARIAKVARAAKQQAPNPAPKVELFGTNLIEPLVGWKVWHLRDGRLWSQVYGSHVWQPMQPLHAKCCRGQFHCKQPPTAECTCGIYARNDFRQVVEFLNHGEACGAVLGWGRYVRGYDGWRAEYCYPARLLIARHSLGDLDKLKDYRVPIYVMEPMRLYDPREDGYEYWQDEADWSFGTTEISHAPQDKEGSGAAGRDPEN